MAVKRKKKTGARAGARGKKRASAQARKTAKAKAKAVRRVAARGRGAAKRAPAARITARNVTPEEAAFLREHARALSKTTKSAKWIHSPDEHEDRPGQSLATRSHEVIQRWAEERGAMPATIEGTTRGDRAGVLRLNFPGYASGKLKEIAWEDWFKTFDERDLVFLFQEHKRDGKQSNFFQLDSPYRERG